MSYSNNLRISERSLASNEHRSMESSGILANANSPGCSIKIPSNIEENSSNSSMEINSSKSDNKSPHLSLFFPLLQFSESVLFDRGCVKDNQKVRSTTSFDYLEIIQIKDFYYAFDSSRPISKSKSDTKVFQAFPVKPAGKYPDLEGYRQIDGPCVAIKRINRNKTYLLKPGLEGNSVDRQINVSRHLEDVIAKLNSGSDNNDDYRFDQRYIGRFIGAILQDPFMYIIYPKYQSDFLDILIHAKKSSTWSPGKTKWNGRSREMNILILCAQVLEGIKFYFNANLYHLDIKPENIMIADEKMIEGVPNFLLMDNDMICKRCIVNSSTSPDSDTDSEVPIPVHHPNVHFGTSAYNPCEVNMMPSSNSPVILDLDKVQSHQLGATMLLILSETPLPWADKNNKGMPWRGSKLYEKFLTFGDYGVRKHLKKNPRKQNENTFIDLIQSSLKYDPAERCSINDWWEHPQIKWARNYIKQIRQTYQQPQIEKNDFFLVNGG
jgi:serine/threonine protein kinase